MSFFVGRFSDGKTVLSLNKASGGTINDHKVPNANTIFHSDMPYVIITGTYTANLSSVGNDYYVCAMPAAIQNILSNDRGAVVLTVVKFTDGSSTMLYGSSSVRSTGRYLNPVGLPRNSSSAEGYLTRTSNHIAMNCGTYTYNGSNHVYSIEENGTGNCVHHSNMVAMGGAAANIDNLLGTLYSGLGYVTGSSFTAVVGTPYTDPNWAFPIGPYGNAHTHFFISNASIRFCNSYGNSSSIGTNIYAPGGNVKANRLSITKLIASNIQTKNVTSTNLGKTPASVTWYTTNLRFNGSAFSANAIFTGNEIKISKNSFIINGIEVNNNSTYKFINQVKVGNIANRADMLFVGTNVYKSSPTIGTNGVSAYSASNNGTISLGGSATGGCQVSIYNFSGSKSWSVDTRDNTISTEYGDVWGPANIPLKVFAGATARYTFGDDNTLKQLGNGYTALQTLSMGIPSTSTVVVAIEVEGTSIVCSQGYVNNNSSNVFQIQKRARASYSYTDNTQFSILTLPANTYVPIYAMASQINSEVTGQGSDAVGYTGVEVYLKNKGDGSVEVGVYKNNSDTAFNNVLFVPQINITIQRLT